MPLLVELVMDTQVQKTNSDDGHYYSHTGNSWNQSDIDEAYRLYYGFQPTDSDQLTEPVRKELEDKGHLPPRKVESFVQKLS